MTCNSTLQCLVWGSILVMLIVVVYNLRQTSERMGEFARDLTILDNHYRLAAGVDPTSITNMEFRTALKQADLRYRTSEEFVGRIASNVDPKEDDYMNLVY